MTEFDELDSPLRGPSDAGGGAHGNAILTRLDFLAPPRAVPHPPALDWNAATVAHKLAAREPRRGGRVALQPILAPETEYAHADKGDALYAFELALSLEKLNFQKLRHLHEVAEKHGDSQMCDFVEGDLLNDQADAVKAAAERVAQLRRVGQGLGVFEFDRQLAA